MNITKKDLGTSLLGMGAGIAISNVFFDNLTKTQDRLVFWMSMAMVGAGIGLISSAHKKQVTQTTNININKASNNQ